MKKNDIRILKEHILRIVLDCKCSDKFTSKHGHRTSEHRFTYENNGKDIVVEISFNTKGLFNNNIMSIKVDDYRIHFKSIRRSKKDKICLRLLQHYGQVEIPKIFDLTNYVPNIAFRKEKLKKIIKK